MTNEMLELYYSIVLNAVPDMEFQQENPYVWPDEYINVVNRLYLLAIKGLEFEQSQSGDRLNSLHPTSPSMIRG